MAFMQNHVATMRAWVTQNAFPSLPDTNIGVELCIRKRFTIAEVNAGATLLAALPEYKYRMIDCTMISVGGAVGAATAVVINATLSGSSRSLLSVAIAALTQSAVVRAGASNATVLADGASYTVNDKNTAITIAKTGSTATTATHIDVIFCYVTEKP